MSYTLQIGPIQNECVWTFVVESDNQKGWAWMRLIRIQEGDSVIEPATHDRLWRARSSKQRNGPKLYALVGAFGDPGSYIPLTLST